MSRKENLATPVPADTRPLYDVEIKRTVTEVQHVRVHAEDGKAAEKIVAQRIKEGRHRNGFRRPDPAAEPTVATVTPVD